MQQSYTAVEAATDLRVHARNLREWWEAAFGDSRAPTQTRSVIQQSWSRLSDAGLDPGHLRPQAASLGQDLDELRARSPLQRVMPVLRHFLGAIATEAEHVMVVCDAGGRILWLEGHPRVLEGADAIEFRAGMSWTESSAGTNAIGTALAIDHPLQIFSAEHFLPEQHPWWCSASPIHDPATGAILGVVNISGPERTAHPHSLALVTAVAKLAEHALREMLPPHASTTGRVLQQTDLPTLQLRLLGHPPYTLDITGRGPVVSAALTLRQAEALALLTVYPRGLSAERMTSHLYGERGRTVSTRALMSRLRQLLGPCLLGRPYRLLADVKTDVHYVEALLRRGRTVDALHAYAGPLLAESQARRIEDERYALSAEVRQAALAANADGLWAWLHHDEGRDHLEAMNAFLTLVPATDARAEVIAARLHALEEVWSAQVGRPEP